MDSGDGEREQWWLRDAPAWAESALRATLFAVGVACLVQVPALLIPSDPLPVPMLMLIAAALSAVGFVWFFSPMYAIRDTHLIIEPGLDPHDARAVSRMRELAVGHSLAPLPIYAFAAALCASYLFAAASSFGVVAWWALFFMVLLVLGAASWGAAMVGLSPRVLPLWRIRLGYDRMVFPVNGSGKATRPAHRLAGAAMGVALLLVSVVPALAGVAAESARSARVLGVQRSFGPGTEVELVQGALLKVPPGWSALVTTGGSMSLSDALQGVTLKSANEDVRVSIEIHPKRASLPYDPMKLADSARRNGRGGRSVSVIQAIGWNGSAYMWEKSPNTWKSELPERLLVARLDGGEQTLLLTVSWPPDSRLQAETDPAAIVETLVETLQLRPTAD